jgi:hypothetical protein
MAKGHPDLPRAVKTIMKKSSLIADLQSVDADQNSTQRVLTMENDFRRRMSNHVASLPSEDAKFQKFYTNPFVVMIQCLHQKYSRISQIERDILPAKLFSSMETSAGRMVEVVALPIYGWEPVLSEMHTTNSALDGKHLDRDTLKLATLKSGPRCLNDEMSENFADAILAHAGKWAREAGVQKIDFTYGVLYGTETQSNKKDWHILRNLKDKLSPGVMTVPPDKQWRCEFIKDGVQVSASIKIGIDWWKHLGGDSCLTELCIALIRACVSPGCSDPSNYKYTISDLGQIVSTSTIPEHFNVSILQRSQLTWLFFLARHFCDEVQDI